MSMDKRIYLSPPNVDTQELSAIKDVLESGWVAPVGPAIRSFESKVAAYFPDKEVVALQSGTSALHLSLRLSEIKPGDFVVMSSFNFAACANVALYEQAVPVFLDSEEQTWGLDPDLLDSFLAENHKRVGAVIVTHLFGFASQIHQIKAICKRYEVLLIEDAAESFGAKIQEEYVGGMSSFGMLSFNGNKLITTSGGGALICDSKDKEKAIHLATQANKGVFDYDHDQMGYNYRLSNVLAALGLAQLEKMEDFLIRKRTVHERYREALDSFFTFLDPMPASQPSYWLTTARLKSSRPVMDLILFLDKWNIETRRLWKPLHLHTPFRGFSFIGSGVCENIYSNGICLPSGTGLSESEQAYVIEKIKAWCAQ